METYKIENLTFTYPNRENAAINNISLSVNRGEFVILCGKSGCGKTTLLRLMKSSLAPHGKIEGEILFEEAVLENVDAKTQASQIGFVMQNPDNQIVTDKVWHELAFGLESLGLSTAEIRTRVAEMASFFGIQTWFHKKVTELSGGQKQMLNLASVMAMQPSVLILDEPTSQLDPIAAQEFLQIVEKINRELGVTVILSEHRLEDAIPMSDRVIVMDNGQIVADSKPHLMTEILKKLNHEMYMAMPVPMRIHGAVRNELPCPVTVREGRAWLDTYSQTHPLNPNAISKPKAFESDEIVIEMRDVHFKYAKDMPDVVSGLDLKVKAGELFAIVGGNGSGKTTALSLMCGINAPQRGEIYINGEKIEKVKNLHGGVVVMLPQNPQSLFTKKTVLLDLEEMVSGKKIDESEKERKIDEIATVCRIEALLLSHPYDLSGGEAQRVALAKVLLTEPQILLLDEPTKGMDSGFKREFAEILKSLKQCGTTVVMVSHDIEFCAEFADRCAMFFDGKALSQAGAREFFAGKNFYTTAANRMARHILPDAVLAEDVILACGGEIKKPTPNITFKTHKKSSVPEKKDEKKAYKLSLSRIIWGCVFALLFIITSFLPKSFFGVGNLFLMQIIAVAEIMGALVCFFPNRKLGMDAMTPPKADRKLNKRTLVAALIILVAIPLTIFFGITYLGDKKYYFISLLIMLETMIPFCMVFENRKPQARELVIISVLCAIAVAGRTAFFMLPQFKPVVAVVIIAGVCFGGETGFLVGAMTGLVSNFFFGQGTWTPWQMFAFGIIGFLAGVMFRKGLLRKTRLSLCIFGALATFFIYGGIMNPASVIMWQPNPTWEMIASAYIVGIPFDFVHAASTALFLWFISEAMIDKLERVKIKYGIIE